MGEDNTYNGWKNYETWAVGLFLDGNYTGEGTYREVQDSLERIVRDRNEAAGNGEQPFYKSYVADFLKQYVEEWAQPDLGASLAADLLGAALGNVDWFELAESRLSELVEA